MLRFIAVLAARRRYSVALGVRRKGQGETAEALGEGLWEVTSTNSTTSEHVRDGGPEGPQ